jgi:DsbC/DsbD-like thiol-disulfide interchange protein
LLTRKPLALENRRLPGIMLRKLRSFCSGMFAQARRICHPLFLARMGAGLAVVLTALPAKSDPFASAWSGQDQDKAKLRLIAAVEHGDAFEAAVEIKLSPNAITYWRAPGDAGVPPTFSVEGSENVARAEVQYPAPSRIDEQGIEAFGYRGGAIFPIRVHARDATKPVRLKLTVNYAVCENICLPEKGGAELVLPRSGDSPEAATIAAAEARVPVTLAAQDVADKVTVAADQTAANPTWLLTWKGAGPATDLFAEAPDGWSFATHRLADGKFSLIAVQQPLSGHAAQVPLRLTLTGPPKAQEFTIDLQLAVKPTGSSSTGPTVGTK